MKPNINTGLFSVEALWKNSEIWWVDAQYHATDNNWKLQARSFFFGIPWSFKIFHDRFKPDLREDDILGNMRKWHYCLKFGGMLKYTMQIIIWNGHAQSVFAFSDLGQPRVLSFPERLV